MSEIEVLKYAKPTIAAQWHPTLNDPLTSDQVAATSTEEVWWQCDQGHEWLSAIAGRRGSGKTKASCPVCRNVVLVKGVNDLSSQLPHIAELWNSGKNTVSPGDVSRANSDKSNWWRCPEKHEWQTSVKAMSLRKNGFCLVCSKSQVVAGSNDLATTNPELIQFWDLENNLREMTTLTSISYYKAHWKCPSGHQWILNLRAQLSREMLCTECIREDAKHNSLPLNTRSLIAQEGLEHIIINGKKISLDTVILMDDHWDNKNGVFSIKNIELIVWTEDIPWKCPEGHSYLQNISTKIRKRGCPVCSGRQVVTGVNDVLTKFPDLVHQIDPADTSNPDLSIVTFSSKETVLWTCSLGHKYLQSVVSKLRSGRVSHCKVCSGKEVQPGVNDLASTHPELIQSYWHPLKNIPLTPEQFSRGSHTKIWWQGECGHEWHGSIYHLVVSGRRCPVCSGKKVQSGFNDAGTKYPDLVDSWHPTKNGDITIFDIGFGIDDKFWWKCEKGHAWKATARNRGTLGTDCPNCGHGVSKGELAIHEFIVASLPLETEIIPNDRLTIGKELDIYIPEKKIAIEYNGVYWHSDKNPKITNSYHYNKWLACKQAGIQLIQIWEDEWNDHPDIVKAMLSHKLGASTQRRVAARKTVVKKVSHQVARDFYDAHHIQGFASSSHYLALVEKTGDGTPVALLGLRMEKDGTSDTCKKGNIVRYATNANVVGGFSKLLAYVERTFTELSSLYTFSDHCVSDGGLYENNGFIAVRELAPDYMYVVGNKRQHKFGYRLNRFKTDPALIWEEGKTERELAQMNDLPRIWDAGKTKWEKRVR